MRWKSLLSTTLLLTVMLLCSFLLPTLILRAGLDKSVTIQSQGRVSSVDVTFILRYEWIGAMKTADDVDKYVGEHPWGNAIMLTDGSDGILSIISYTGYDPTKAWVEGKGPTYAQLKTVIDRFHYHGWKVIYSPGNTPTEWGNPWIWNYLTQEYPELIFMDGNGKRVGVEKTNVATLIANFFANYTTDDIERNISAGSRLIDLYTNRLKQMILDGAFEWDGFFGVDGWNGLTQSYGGQPYYWLWATNQPFNRPIGTNNVEHWFDASYQSFSEWENSSYVPMGFPPVGWETMSNIEKAVWARSNANLEWWYYWQDRFAQMYAQIRQVFVDTRAPEWFVGTILSQDPSSTWADNGGNNPVGMENLTAFGKYHSFDHYYIDCEAYNSYQQRHQAYVAGLVKSKLPEAHAIIGTILDAWWIPAEKWHWKQMFIALSQTYVWKDGTRYRAIDPTWLIVNTPSNTTWSDEKWHGCEFAGWTKAMVSLMKANIYPIWLGPVDVLPVYRGSQMYTSINFTFAQFTDVMNIKDHPEYITEDWGTIVLDQVIDAGIYATGIYSKVIDLFVRNKLNVIYHGYGYDARFSSFFGEGEEESKNTFRLTGASIGASQIIRILSKDELSDPYARWIASGYYDTEITDVEFTGSYFNDTGFIPIANYNDGYVAFGIYYNSTSANFLYGRSWSEGGWNPHPKIPREIINRAIYWASKSPINSSESLLDFKIFGLDDGTILLTMIDLKNVPENYKIPLNASCSSTLSIDAARLGLDNPSNYIVYWQSDSSRIMTFSDWNNVQVTLRDGADILVIEPK